MNNKIIKLFFGFIGSYFFGFKAIKLFFLLIYLNVFVFF